MFYSSIGILALLILLIENQDILTNRRGGFSAPAWKIYRHFLYAVVVYYITDIIWGFLEEQKLATLLFIDTSVYFTAMACGVWCWTKYTVTYLEEDSRYGRFFLYAGRVFAALMAGLAVLNIFVPVLFTVSADCVYEALVTRYILLIAQIFLLLLLSVFAFTAMVRRKWAAKRKEKYLTLGIFGLIMAFFLFVQLWYPYLPLYAIAYLLGTCLIRALVIGNEKEEYRQELQEQQKRLADDQMKEERAAYVRISALAGEFLSIHVVNPKTGQYREYSATESFGLYALPKEGDDFFTVAREVGKTLVVPEDLEMYLSRFTREAIVAKAEKGGVYSLSYRLMVEGKPCHVQFKAAMVEEPEGSRLIAGISNVDSQVRQEEEYARKLAQARSEANVDPLTGVKNRHAYLEAEERMNRQIREGQSVEFAIVLLDLNDLKKINDTEGHQAGDQYLCNACRIICQTFKRSPVYRIGGDEFAVIAKGADYKRIDELTAAVQAHNERSIREGGIVIACGTASFTAKDDSMAAVFERADAAMYENKRILKTKSGTAEE